MADRRAARIAVAALAALMAACAPHTGPPPENEAQGPPGFPDGDYRRLLAQGGTVYRIDPARSLVVVEVRRGGALARFGHDHVVASHDVAGYLAPDEGRADFYVPLDALVVDEPALRATAGFDTQPSSADVAGTRGNMLEKVLETGRHPYALIAVSGAASGSDAQRPRVAVTLHGTTAVLDAAVRLEGEADEIAASGTVAIEQSRFGIVPFSLLGGAIAVQDRVTIRYRILARRMDRRASEARARPGAPA